MIISANKQIKHLVIQNLLVAHKRLCEQGNVKEIIKLSALLGKRKQIVIEMDLADFSDRNANDFIVENNHARKGNRAFR